jgi:enediyne biosynthesis protein E4
LVFKYNRFCFYVRSMRYKKKLFSIVSPAHSGIKFKNILKETKDFNVLTYGYLYNGGGVAVGDINNDGLEDIYFTGNMVASRLYVNQGDFRFKEIAKEAGVAATGLWNTGTSMVDINGDGYLDIFVCRSAAKNPLLRKNLFFINNGDLTFTERAELMGLNDTGYTTQTLFFDYDRDGDLDLYVLNHSVQEYAGLNRLTPELKQRNDPNFGDKLYENVSGIFLDRTISAGIFTNVLGFGLGIAAADFNNDQWMDLYISNDYNEPDYLYINNKNGTFSEQLSNFIDHTSMFSMGSDVADVNNDGDIDIFTLDMLPEGNQREKMVFGPDNFEKYQRFQKSGFYKQTMRNMLHVNNGGEFFSEIGQFSGISNTDWSWASLFADFDNDGNKDLFITNGYKRDYTNMDFVSYAVQQKINETQNNQQIAILDLIEQIPSSIEENYIYKNNGDLRFKKMNLEWGIDQKTLSNGAAYADLDNDGDLDLIVNNIDTPALLYKNNTSDLINHNFIDVLLSSSSENRTGIGAKVSVFSQGEQFHLINQPVRGFQSSVSQKLHFGLGNLSRIDSILVLWPEGEIQKFSPNRINTTLLLKKERNLSGTIIPHEKKALFSKTEISGLDKLIHQENTFNDFNRERLLPYQLSTQGPKLALGDVNNDGLEDIYFGGAKGIAGQLMLQQRDGSFQISKQPVFDLHNDKEDVDALFFDADGDKDLDLYVVSGGNEVKNESLQDRLYLNVAGVYRWAEENLPKVFENGSCVASSDFDNDGDLDLFVGSRNVPGQYPLAPKSQFLINQGNGDFKLNNSALPNENQLGMITDVLWMDIDSDKDDDLIIVGDWMPITILQNTNHSFIKANFEGLEDSFGLWNCIEKGDVDNDGDEDFIVGNLGLNSQLKANVTKPMTVFYGDFDNNGAIDPILCKYYDDKNYPFFSKDDLQSQLSNLKSAFVSYAAYADQTIYDILKKMDIKKIDSLQVKTLASSIVENLGNMTFQINPLPKEAQLAPVFGIKIKDINQDHFPDLILGGNLMGTRVKLGQLNASRGICLLGNGKGDFRSLNISESGLNIKGEIRAIEAFNDLENNTYYIFALNNAAARVFKLNENSNPPK